MNNIQELREVVNPVFNTAKACLEFDANYNGPLVKTTTRKNIVNKSDFGCIPSQALLGRAKGQPPAQRVAEP